MDINPLLSCSQAKPLNQKILWTRNGKSDKHVEKQIVQGGSGQMLR